MITTFKDSNYTVWFTFFGLGFCSLLPWNLLLNSLPYFDTKVLEELGTAVNATGNVTSPFTQSMTFASMAPLLVVTCVTPLLYMISPVKKVGLGLAGIFIMLGVLLAIMQMSAYFYVTSIIAIAVTSCAFSLLQSSLLAMASNFPMAYMTPVTVGQAGCGIVTALVREYIKHKYPHDEDGALVYIVFGVLLAGFTLYAYWKLFYNDFFTFYIEAIAPEKKPAELFKSANCTAKTWIYFITMWVSCSSTLTVLPSVVFDVEMDGQKIVQYSLLCFNLSDLFGRALGSVLPGPGKNPWVLVGLASLRFCAAVSFLFCAVAPKTSVPTYLGTIPFFIILTFFGLAGGYIIGMCFAWAPVGNKDINLSFVGYAMTFALSIGLVTGSIIAVPVRMFI